MMIQGNVFKRFVFKRVMALLLVLGLAGLCLSTLAGTSVWKSTGFDDCPASLICAKLGDDTCCIHPSDLGTANFDACELDHFRSALSH